MKPLALLHGAVRRFGPTIDPVGWTAVTLTLTGRDTHARGLDAAGPVFFYQRSYHPVGFRRSSAGGCRV
jgi:hypothetical protein